MIFRKKFSELGAPIIVILLALLSTVFQLVFYHTMGFHRDELLYFALGGHPAFGYQSVPPFIGLVALISVKIFGYTLFAAKFFPAVAGGFTIYLAALIARELSGTIYAQMLTALALCGCILFLRAFSLFQPVSFDIFFWALSFYLIVRFINTGSEKFVYWLGLTFGLAFLNKYNIAFLILPLLIVLPFTRFRNLFARRAFYLAILIAFLIALPNLIWQLVNHFPVVRHMSELRSTQLEKVGVGEFFSEQVLMIFPATFLAVPGLLYLFLSSKMKNYRLPAVMVVVVVALYLLFHGKGYYAAGIYPFLIAAGAVFYEKVLKKWYLRIPLVAILLFLSWSILPIGKPIYSPDKLVRYFDRVKALTGDDSARRFEDNSYHKLPQDYADMLGWDELAALTNKAWQLVADKKSCIIFCENYGEAGAISILGKKYGLPEPLSFNDAFRYWIPRKFDRETTTVIYINGEPGQDVKDLFADIQKIGQVDNPLARESGVGVFLCQNPRSSFNQFWEAAVKKMNAVN